MAKKRRRIRWDRVGIVFGPLLLLILILAVSCHSRNAEESSAADISQVSSMSELNPTTNIQTSGDAVPVEAEIDEIVVCIDAGHGGEDDGAVNQSKTRFEKDDNLRLALAVEQAFAKYPNVKTVMTRTTDVFVELQERCDIANNANADYFISLHRNSALNGNGVEIWINNKSGRDNTWDKRMAEYIMDWLDQAGVSQRRGIRTGFRNDTSNNESNNYYVNRYTNMPSCLIEMGFMTSEIDNRYFDENLNQYAESIAAALIEMLADNGLYNAAQP